MLRVLIVDDDPTLRGLFALMLERRGHVVATAATTADAKRQCVAMAADVVALDMRMPDGNGAELIATLRLTATPPRIVAMSGDTDALRTALDRGADATLHKPFSAAELLECVEGATARAALTA